LSAKNGNAQIVGDSKILDSTDVAKMSLKAGASSCTFASDNIDECKSFVSWLNTKFTRFFVAINITKLGPILNNDYFRFVPAPPTNADGTYKWDHIYTDEELYKLYGLDKEDAKTADGVRYTDIIEAVIKERK
jgi:hypothetical protein